MFTLLSFLFTFSALSSHVLADVFTVSTVEELNSQIANATAGTTIVMQNGVYTTNSSIDINCAGDLANPILIRSETIGGVEISGSKGFKFNKGAAFVTIQGFNFTHVGSVVMDLGAHNCRLTRNVIQLSIPSGSDSAYVLVRGD